MSEARAIKVVMMLKNRFCHPGAWGKGDSWSVVFIEVRIVGIAK